MFQDVSSAAPTEARPVTCNISISDPVSELDSISLTVSTPGPDCSFTLSAPDSGGDGSECRRRTRAGEEEIETNEIGGKERGEEEEQEEETGVNYLGTNQLGEEDRGDKETGGVFTCVLDHLEPGTTYQLQVQSHGDQETANITLHTSESKTSNTQGPLTDLFQSFHQIHTWCSLS